MTENYMSPRVVQLIQAIRDPGIKLVSFDVFDTLIRRSISNPNHLFWILGAELERREHDKEWCRRFGEARAIAGSRAIHHANLSGKEDASLEEIYAFLALMLPEAAPTISDIMQMELELEAAFLEPYPLGKKLFQEALDSGKRVILASDQYMPIEFLKGLLSEYGYSGYEKFFLSGDIGVLKHSGTMYEWMATSLGVQRKEILHIGDNHHVDVVVPQKRGVNALAMPTSFEMAGHPGIGSAVTNATTLGSVAVARYLHRRSDRAVSGAILPHPDHTDFLGNVFYGPVLYSIAAWLVDKIRTGRVDRIWLLARDGQGLAKLISRAFPEYADKFEYVYASRRLIVYPSGNLSGVEIYRHFQHLVKAGVRVHEFLEEISSELIDFSPLKADFGDDDRLDDKAVLNGLRRALDSFCNGWDPTSSEGAQRVIRYYRSCIRGGGRIGLFDVGWRGNLQRGLEKLLGDEPVEFLGLYLGYIYEHETFKPHVQAECFAFGMNFPPEVFSDLEPNIWPLEFMFGGSELSAVGIQETARGWEPVFEQANPTKSRLCDLALRYQEAAVDFIDDCMSWNPKILELMGAQRFGVELMREFLAHPAYYDANALSNVSWTANIDENTGRPFIAGYRRSARSIRKAFEESLWKAGFMAVTGPKKRKKLHRSQKRKAYWGRKEAKIRRLLFRR